MYAGILIGYFGQQDEARKAFRQLRRKGYRRAAWVSKSADGAVRIRDPIHWLWAFTGVVAFILFGALASIVSTRLEWPAPAAFGGEPIPILVGGLIGAFLCVVLMP